MTVDLLQAFMGTHELIAGYYRILGTKTGIETFADLSQQHLKLVGLYKGMGEEVQKQRRNKMRGWLLLGLLVLMMLLVGSVGAQEPDLVTNTPEAVVIGLDEQATVGAPVVEPTLPTGEVVDTAPAWLERILNSPVMLIAVLFGGVFIILLLVILFLVIIRAMDRLYKSLPADDAKLVSGAAGASTANLYASLKQRAEQSETYVDDLALLVSGPLIEAIIKRLNQQPATLTPEAAALIREGAAPAGDGGVG